jgi:hypothetical protein
MISHELFSMADEQMVARALDALAWAAVYLVCTARDLARQLPAVWQEDVKNRQVLTFAEFARELAESGPDPHFLASLFWRLQDIPRVLRIWTQGCPPTGSGWSPYPSRAARRTSCGAGSARRSTSIPTRWTSICPASRTARWELPRPIC